MYRQAINSLHTKFSIFAAFTSEPTSENLKKVDEHYNTGLKSGDYCPLYNALKDEESTHIDYLWRRARAERLYAINNVPPLDTKFKEVLLSRALHFSKLAIETDENHWQGHKWYAILLSDKSGLEGTKAQLLASPIMKEHFEKAIKLQIELNELDANTLHALACWHYSFADLGWVQRKVASTIFAKVPESTYEAGLEYFEQAEETSPGFYTMNWYYLCLCYKKLAIKASYGKDAESQLLKEEFKTKYGLYKKKLLEFEPRDVEEKEALRLMQVLSRSD